MQGVRLLAYVLATGLAACAKSRSPEASAGEPAAGVTEDGDGAGGNASPRVFTGCESPARVYCQSIAACCEAAGQPIDMEVCTRARRNGTWLTPIDDPQCEPNEQHASCRRLMSERFPECRHRRADEPFEDQLAEACANPEAEAYVPGPGQECTLSRTCRQPEGSVVVCVTGHDGAPSVCSRPYARSPLGAGCNYGCPRALIVPLARIGDEECEELSGLSRHALYVGPARRLFVQEGALYWLEHHWLSGSRLWRGSVDGAEPPHMLAENLQLDLERDRVVLGAQALHFARGDTLQRLSLSDGNLGAPVYFAHGIGAIALEPSGDAEQAALWVASDDCTRLTRVPQDGSEPSELEAELPDDFPRGFVTDVSFGVSDNLYCATGNRLLRYTRDPPAGAQLAVLEGESITALVALPDGVALVVRRRTAEGQQSELRKLDAEGRTQAGVPVEWPAVLGAASVPSSSPRTGAILRVDR